MLTLRDCNGTPAKILVDDKVRVYDATGEITSRLKAAGVIVGGSSTLDDLFGADVYAACVALDISRAGCNGLNAVLRNQRRWRLTL